MIQEAVEANKAEEASPTPSLFEPEWEATLLQTLADELGPFRADDFIEKHQEELLIKYNASYPPMMAALFTINEANKPPQPIQIDPSDFEIDFFAEYTL